MRLLTGFLILGVVAGLADAAERRRPQEGKLAVGDPAPTFTLDRLGGEPVDLAKLRDKPIVLVFGSCT